MRHRLTLVARCALALGLLAWLAWTGRLDLTALAAGRTPGLHVLALALVSSAVLLQTVRWWRLLASQGVALPFPKVLRVNWIGYFYALLLPGIGGGDVVRGLYIMRQTPGARLRATSTVLVDRSIGLYASLWLAAFSAVGMASWANATGIGLRRLRLTVLVLVALSSVAAALILWRPSRRPALRLLGNGVGNSLEEIAAAYAARPGTLGSCFLLSLASSAAFLTAFWLAGRVLGVALSPAQVLLVVPLVFVANALPLSPGGVGVGETAAALLFSICGVQGAATVMLTFRVWQALVRVPGLLLQIPGVAAHPPAPIADRPMTSPFPPQEPPS